MIFFFVSDALSIRGVVCPWSHLMKHSQNISTRVCRRTFFRLRNYRSCHRQQNGGTCKVAAKKRDTHTRKKPSYNQATVENFAWIEWKFSSEASLRAPVPLPCRSCVWASTNKGSLREQEPSSGADKQCISSTFVLKPKEKTVKEELELEEGRHVHSRDISSSAVFYFFSSTLNYFNRSVTEIWFNAVSA